MDNFDRHVTPAQSSFPVEVIPQLRQWQPQPQQTTLPTQSQPTTVSPSPPPVQSQLPLNIPAQSAPTTNHRSPSLSSGSTSNTLILPLLPIRMNTPAVNPVPNPSARVVLPSDLTQQPVQSPTSTLTSQTGHNSVRHDSRLHLRRTLP